MSPPRDEWQAGGAFRVAVACQAGGRFGDAIEAYERVLVHKRFHEHLPTLHNLAVSQIRAQSPGAALDTLDRLDVALKRDWNRKQRAVRRFSVAYNRALALRYLSRYGDAQQVLVRLLRALLLRPAGAADSAALELPALMLFASVVLQQADAQGVRQAAASLTKSPSPPALDRNALRDAICAGSVSPQVAEAYVREHAERDPRAHYNLLCFCAQLADRVEEQRSALLDLALADAELAFRDRRLAAWARQDPALDLAVIRASKAWPKLLDRYDAANAAVAAVPAVQTAPAVPA
jgi:hypothetical protein